MPRTIGIEEEFHLVDLTTRTVLWENLDVVGTSSPTWHDGTLYVLTGAGDLAAVDATTGETLWQSPLDTQSVGFGSPIVSVAEVTVEDFDRVMAVNARGTFLGIKHVAPVMLARKSGSIINISSMGALRGGLPAKLVDHRKVKCFVAISMFKLGGGDD